MVMAKTASLKATNRPVSRCAEGESAPALPPGARAIASQRIQRITEDTSAAPRRGGRACIAARAASTAAGLNPSLGARKVVRKPIREPEINEIYAAYTLIRENLHITILGGRDDTFDCVGQGDPC
jgi:hypothetical protein